MQCSTSNFHADTCYIDDTGQYADWGVDLIKNDCIFAGNMIEDNIKGVSTAIAKSGRPTVYSLSPGGGDPKTEFGQAQSISDYVNIYRVTGDWHGGNMEYVCVFPHPLRFLLTQGYC